MSSLPRSCRWRGQNQRLSTHQAGVNETKSYETDRLQCVGYPHCSMNADFVELHTMAAFNDPATLDHSATRRAGLQRASALFCNVVLLWRKASSDQTATKLRLAASLHQAGRAVGTGLCFVIRDSNTQQLDAANCVVCYSLA